MCPITPDPDKSDAYFRSANMPLKFGYDDWNAADSTNDGFEAAANLLLVIEPTII